jgi:cytochrome P450
VTASDNFLTKLIASRAEGRASMPHILDSCGSNIAVGSDTTAISLSSTLYYLYNRPNKLAKLRKEIDHMAAQNLASDPGRWHEAHNMTYLQAVIKESRRIHPAVGTILPLKVPKGGLQLAETYFPEQISNFCKESRFV